MTGWKPKSWLAAAWLLSCAKTPAPAPPQSYTFPAGFQWSVSESAEESEGNNLTNDWHVFEDMGQVPPAGMAQNTYNLYDTDFANAQSLHLNAFQMTIEWARLVPNMPADPTAMTMADVDQTELAHYHTVIDDLVAHGFTPTITVTHYTLPIWVDNPAAFDMTNLTITDGSLGGWTNPVTGQALASYAGFLAQEFGSQVQWWLTEDEPMDDVICGYMTGTFPPGLNDFDLTAVALPNQASIANVIENMIAGHALAYRAIHAVQPNAHVSIAHNSLSLLPLEPDNPDDVAAVTRTDHIYNLLYLDALTTGQFDTGLVGTGPMVQHPEWANSLDFIGVNYYDSNYVVVAPGLLEPLGALPCNGNLGSTLLQVLGCPAEGPPGAPGLISVLTEYNQRYHLPMFITESGTISSPEGKATFLVKILMALHEAMAQGANVLGYSLWTLSYDYEWNDGYTQDMGLYDIAGFGGGGYAGADGGLPQLPDGGIWAPGPDTDFTRIPDHPFIDVYQAIVSANAIPPSLVAQYAPDGG